MIKLVDRFMKHALPEPNTGCWLWMGYLKPNGYGTFSPSRTKREYAHRYSYAIFCGEIPHGLVIDHKCGIRSCVNPDHLDAVTQAENVKRGISKSAIHNKAKIHCPKGHPYSIENTLVYRGGRYCRKCKNISSNRYGQ